MGANCFLDLNLSKSACPEDLVLKKQSLSYIQSYIQNTINKVPRKTLRDAFQNVKANIFVK